MLAREIGNQNVAPLKLGVASTIDNDVLDEVIAEVGGSLPGFELTLSSGSSEELIELGMDGTLDLLIVEVPDNKPDRLETWGLFEQIYHMVTREEHPLAAKDTVMLTDIRDEPWIEFCGDEALALRDAAKTAGFEPTFRHRADSPAHLRRLVLAGFGSAFVPPPRERSRMVALRLPEVDASKEVVLAAIAGRRRSAAASAFVRASRARAWNTETSISQ